MKRIRSLFVISCVLFFCSIGHATLNLYIGPYIQQLSPTSVTIYWAEQKNFGTAYSLHWGDNQHMAHHVSAQYQHVTYWPSLKDDFLLFSVKLTKLKPNTRYYYQIVRGRDRNHILSFQTPMDHAHSFAFLAMSDAQNKSRTTRRAIKESVMKYAVHEYTDREEYPVEFILFPGDLVHKGHKFPRWKKEFFSPLSPLLSFLPLFPALGNHDEHSPYYFKFFNLPLNGSPAHQEEWYYFDRSNVRFITLNTDEKGRLQKQIEWLKNTLNDAKKNELIDFVITQFHHPYQSELWPKGDTVYAGRIQQLLEEFSCTSQKPSVYLCGHTHGYSRGHSYRANHTMLVIGSIGSFLDKWDTDSRDHPEYIITLAQHGWMLVQVEMGPSPQIRFFRYSSGNKKGEKEEAIVDQFVIKRKNLPPSYPQIIFPEQEKTFPPGIQKIFFKTTTFYDQDNDGHLSTQLQVSVNREMESPIVNKIVNYKNVFRKKDRNRNISLTNLKIKLRINERQKYYYRIRFRDRALAWSEWSQIRTFSGGNSQDAMSKRTRISRFMVKNITQLNSKRKTVSQY